MKNNYSLFKHLIALSCLLISSSALFAQVKCSTLAEVKKQKAGTEVLYTGEATTTFFGYAGMIIQDNTDALYLKSFDMSEFGSLKATPNMLISNIRGIFSPSDDIMMAEIKIDFPEDAKAIKFIKKSGVGFSIQDITLADLIKNKNSLECKPIRVKDVHITFEGFRYFTVCGSDTLFIGSMAGLQLPALADIVGYYGDDGNVKGLIVGAEKDITPKGYHNFAELQLLTGEIKTPIEIVDKALVSRVTKSETATTLYVEQYSNYGEKCGLAYIVNSTELKVEAGDSIRGIRGIYKTITTNDSKNLAYGSTITDSEKGASIVIVSSKNKISPAEINDLSFLKSAGIINYESQIVVTPVGKVIQKTINGVSQYCLESSNMYETNRVIIKGIDFSEYLGKEIAVIGIVDAGITEPGVIALYLRNEYDILQSNYDFNNLIEMKNVGVSLAGKVTYTVKGNLLVTYTTSWPQEESTIYALYAQDSTGGIFIKSEVDPKVAAGDSVSGLVGEYFEQTKGAPYMYLDSAAVFTAVSHNNQFDKDVKEVFMKDLAENRAKYAGTVVKLIGVQHGFGNIGSTETGLVDGKYLYQGEYKMPYSHWNYKLFDVSDIVGIFDDGGLAEDFSFLPLSQDHITESSYVPVGTEINTEDRNVVVLTSDKTLVADNAQRIVVYSIQGQKVADESCSSLYLGSLRGGIYVIQTVYADSSVMTTKVSL